MAIPEGIEQVEVWQAKLEPLLLSLGERFRRSEPRLRMLDKPRSAEKPITVFGPVSVAPFARFRKRPYTGGRAELPTLDTRYPSDAFIRRQCRSDHRGA